MTSPEEGRRPEPSPVDVNAVMAEIRDDIRRRRQSGEIPPTLERELDAMFAALSPVGSRPDDFDAALERVEAAAFVDAAVPVASLRPGGRMVKQTLRGLVEWYLRYVLAQVNAFNDATARALRLLDERIERVEDAVPVDDVAGGADAWAWVTPQWTAAVTAGMKNVRGRVVHADAGDGSLVEAMVDAGIDAYGLEPRNSLFLAAAARALDVRPDRAIDHFRRLRDGELGGAVLSRGVDRYSVNDQLALLDAAAAKLMEGGRLCVIATDADSWRTMEPRIEVDLAPGHPLHPDTWITLLAQRGFVELEATRGDGPPPSTSVWATRTDVA